MARKVLTRVEAIKALTAKHAKEWQQHNAEYDLRDRLPAELADRCKLHVYELYGSIAELSLDYDNFRVSSDTTPQPTLDDIIILANLLPPEPMVKVSDGCVSFQPKRYVESLPEDKRRGSEDDIAPFIVKVDHNQGRTDMSVEWYAKLGDDLIRVSVAIPLSPKLASVRVWFTGNNRGNRYCNDEFKPNYNVVGQLGEDEQGYLSQLQTVTFAKAGPEYPHHWVMTWYAYREGKNASVLDLVAALQKE